MSEPVNSALPPLDGVRVLDFSTLLPGPLAGLILADAGAEVIKIERPGTGEEMRHYTPSFGDSSGNYALLNGGKRCITIDLKASDAVEKLTPLIQSSNVIIEQFRPGVMDRLGLGFDAVSKINPGIIYCSITGYGQTGPARDQAGHDMNYLARSGLLMMGGDDTGKPVIPPGLIADIGGGALPAVINILLALRQAETTGQGAHLDISMTDGLFAWSFWAQAETTLTGIAPKPGNALLSGGSPRYQIYTTKDGQFMAAAPLEEKFWQNFCSILDIPENERDEKPDPTAMIRRISDRVSSEPAAYWRERLSGLDTCVTLAQTFDQALDDPLFKDRGLFDKQVSSGSEQTIPALPTPLAPIYRSRQSQTVRVPDLGEGNETFLPTQASKQ